MRWHGRPRLGRGGGAGRRLNSGRNFLIRSRSIHPRVVLGPSVLRRLAGGAEVRICAGPGDGSAATGGRAAHRRSAVEGGRGDRLCGAAIHVRGGRDARVRFRQLRTIDDGLVAFPFEVFAPDAADVLHRNFAHGNFADFRLAVARHRVAAHAVVDDGVVVPDHVVVHDGGVAINIDHLRARHEMAAGVVVTEISHAHERVVEGAEAEFKTDAHMAAVVAEAHAADIAGFRRQRGPAAVVPLGTPTHPRRSPSQTRCPEPAGASMMIPAAVVKRGPAPRVVRVPIPAVVRPVPTPAVAIGSPRRGRHRHGGLPAPAVGGEINPTAIRRERIIKLRDLRRARRRRAGNAR